MPIANKNLMKKKKYALMEKSSHEEMGK